MIIRLEAPDGYDVLIGADCIESISSWGAFEGRDYSRIVTKSGEKLQVKGTPAQLYQKLTALGYTQDSRSRRTRRA